jgi:hypothetical protein
MTGLLKSGDKLAAKGVEKGVEKGDKRFEH